MWSAHHHRHNYLSMNNSANAEIRVGKSPLHAEILYGLANLEENFKTTILYYGEIAKKIIEEDTLKKSSLLIF